MGGMLMNKQQELTLINQRIEKLFNVSKFNTQFWIVIVNDIYDHSYNIFLVNNDEGKGNVLFQFIRLKNIH